MIRIFSYYGAYYVANESGIFDCYYVDGLTVAKKMAYLNILYDKYATAIRNNPEQHMKLIDEF